MNREQGKTSGDMDKASEFQTKPRDVKPTEIDKLAATSSNAARQAASEADGSGLDKRVQAHLGRLLRARYQELLEEPIPDKLRLQLDALSKREQKS